MRAFLIAMGVTAYLSIGIAIWISVASSRETECPGEGRDIAFFPALIWPPILGGALIAVAFGVDARAWPCKSGKYAYFH